MNKSVLVASVGLMIGCAAGVVGKEVLVPIAGAQANGTAFQHRCVELKWDDVLGDGELRPELGKDGWELATFVSAEQKGFGGTSTRIVACFKRAVAK